MANHGKTTIDIKKETAQKLVDMKLIPRETYNDVIERLLKMKTKRR